MNRIFTRATQGYVLGGMMGKTVGTIVAAVITATEKLRKNSR